MSVTYFVFRGRYFDIESNRIYILGIMLTFTATKISSHFYVFY